MRIGHLRVKGRIRRRCHLHRGHNSTQPGHQSCILPPVELYHSLQSMRTPTADTACGDGGRLLSASIFLRPRDFSAVP
jgi:hypothetical protein